MPTRISAPPRRNRLPPKLQQTLDEASVNPIATTAKAATAAEPMLRSLGKPLQELLGLVLNPARKGTGLPKRIRLSGFDSASDKISFHGRRRAQDAFESSPQQLDEMIESGMLDVEQPPAGAVAAIRKRLEALLK